MGAKTSGSRPASATVTSNRIVVGVDVPAQDSGPLTWACQEADRVRAALQVVSARPVGVGPPAARPATDIGSDPTESMLRSIAELAHGLCADAEVRPPRVEAGSPPHVLVGALDDQALLLVVGRRTRACVQHLLLGSTSIAVAGRAPVPTVVVPDTWAPGQAASSPVVVGLSGEDDEPLLRFGFDRAASLRVPLVAVHALDIPSLLTWSPSGIARMRARVLTTMDLRLASWRAEFPDLEIVTAAPAERPVGALTDAGRVAQLVVVGRHTRGAGHLGPRLGSTARGVLQHAAVPVAVVPVQPVDDVTRQRTHVSSDVWAPTY
jgi:nucleotide-binding universal stress UspA family protein